MEVRTLREVQKGVCVGNAYEDVADQVARRAKGPTWFVGHFQPDGDPRKVSELCVSLSSEKKGWRRGMWGGQKVATTFSFIVSGVLRVDFPEKSVILRQGDYLLFAPNVDHHVEVLEDATWLSCRAPSIAGDNYNLDHPVREV
jgi:hypothetical protein